MNINFDFLIVAYFISMFVDWVFQWQWQAENKSKWGKDDNKLKSLIAVTSHSLIYAILTTTFSLFIIHKYDKFLIAFLFLLITHTVIDTRIPVKWLMRFKGMNTQQIYDYQNYGFMHIGIDHRLHEICLLILAMLIV
jgi:hypothetical protein